MTKVPPKIQPPPARARPRRSEEARARRPGQTTDEDEILADLKSMAEKLEEERSHIEDNPHWSSGEKAEDEAQLKEEKRQDEEAFAKNERKHQPVLQRKQGSGGGSQLGEQAQPRSQEELKAESNLRRASGQADGFEGEAARLKAAAALKTGQVPGAQGMGKPAPMAPLSAPPPPAPRMGGGGFGAAMKFLNDAKESGFYFRIGRGTGGGGGAPEGESEDDAERALQEAVEEAKAQLGALRGVVQIEGGRDHEDLRVVLILAGKGFCESSMAAIPEQVREFRTVVGVPYELLPLRRI